ncbi:hypothetical protein SCLCIDRAFT_29001 [Scleroderma citrinum Foug A]|uniref:Uncharacterized protein n=1 Tax=Scleroderma citrinum Foug A TaxID=1036808 RepID=A0A0C2Z5M9_9AGAM|nr:hypothetical protein SCLCIDRAFT_29001 [Scleroderma citrinum Foug A]
MHCSIQQTKLILTSQSVDNNKGNKMRLASPVKVDFYMSPYSSNKNSWPHIAKSNPSLTKSSCLRDAPEADKDKLIGEEHWKMIRELKIVVCRYKDKFSEPLQQMKEDIE